MKKKIAYTLVFVGAAGLIALIWLATSYNTTRVKITPWFQYEIHRPFIHLPHAFASGPWTQIGKSKIGNKWEIVYKEVGSDPIYDHDKQPQAIDNENFVLLEWGDIHIFKKGSPHPVVISRWGCGWRNGGQNLNLSKDEKSILCVLPKNEKGDDVFPDEQASSVSVIEYDLNGTITNQTNVPVLGKLKEYLGVIRDFLGLDSSGSPVVSTHDASVPRICMAVALRKEGAVELARVTSSEENDCANNAPDWSSLLKSRLEKY